MITESLAFSAPGPIFCAFERSVLRLLNIFSSLAYNVDRSKSGV